MVPTRGVTQWLCSLCLAALVAASCGNSQSSSVESSGGSASTVGGSSAGGSSGAAVGGSAPTSGGASSAGAGASTDGGASGAAGADDGAPPLRVLFVGNSYTYVNDLPAVVRALGAATPGSAVDVESITLGGATLANHWDGTGARERIAMGGLDVVVLQGQSLEALDAESIVGQGRLFSDAVAAADARAVWFSTWAYRAGDPVFAQTGLTPATMTQRIEQGYALAAAPNGDLVARVGAAWLLALAELPEVVLHADDGSHPAPAGTLLAACVILQAVTGVTPVVPDPPPLDVPLETARALCALAPRVRCLDGMAFCGGRCVDIRYDAEHCGGCDVACEGGDPCRVGVCGCDAGFDGCDRRCVDLETDVSHCGACGTACSVGAVCSDGDCTCPGGSAQPITYEALAALRPGCTSRDTAGSLDCNAAAHELCAALECHDSGFGPPSGHAPTVEAVMCVPGDVQTTTFAELATFVPECTGAPAVSQSCATAIHRFCVSKGAVTGFGPVAVSASDTLSVTCVPSGTLVPTTAAVLQANTSRCVPDAVTCGIGAWNFCVSSGYAGGLGPVEVAGDARTVVCF